MIGAIRNKFNTTRDELFSYSKKERSFIFFAMLCGFFICCEYSIIRPISNSLFIYTYGAHLFPYAWLAIVPFNFLFVALYNRLIPKWGSKKLFTALIGIVVGANLCFASGFKMFPSLSFVFYMWKEIYVLLMFQLVWSVIHANVKFSKAKYLYGFFFGVGGLGSMFGSAFPSFFAVSYGSENLIYLSIPVYLLLYFVYSRMSRYCSGDTPDEKREEKGGFIHGIKLIRSSRFLIFILLIVVFMQMTLAIIDFQFCEFLEKAFSEKDLRTQYAARVMGIIHSLTVGLQFVGTYFLIRWIGIKRTHYLVPSLVAISAALLAAVPAFAMASLAFITCKALDFSVFGVIKEMLYVPLKPDEKFRAKAVIDVFAYRSSKALGSILIIFVTSFANSQVLSWLTMALAILWISSVSFGLKEFEKITAPVES